MEEKQNPSPEQEQPQGQDDNGKKTPEKLWDATVKTFHTATTMANQYTKIVQKKIDLYAIEKKIHGLHSDLGKLVDDARTTGASDLLAGEEVRYVLDCLDTLKQSAASLLAEIEQIRTEPSCEGCDTEH